MTVFFSGKSIGRIAKFTARKVMPMNSDTLTIPRRASGLTAYYVAEAGSITASDMGWDQVNLVAKKLAVLARYSSEVNEDSILDFANTLADEIAYAFANAEDQAGFNGDGTSTYGGITGVRDKLKNLDSTIANISGLFVGAGNAYSELVLTDFEGVVVPGGYAPDYIRRYPAATQFVHEMDAAGKLVASICHGPWVLCSSSMLKGRRATSFFAIKDDVINAGAKIEDAEVVVDGNLVTSRKPEDLPAFCRASIAVLAAQ